MADSDRIAHVEDPERSHELMRRTAVAVLGGAITSAEPAAAPLVVATTPLAEAAVAAIGRIWRRRVEHAAETLDDAAQASPDPPEEFIRKTTSDDRLIELTTRALQVAQDTALRVRRSARRFWTGSRRGQGLPQALLAELPQTRKVITGRYHYYGRPGS